MKTLLTLFLVIILTAGQLNAQSSGNVVVDAILSGYSAKNFNSVPVTEQQLDLILKCGLSAPSARNLQPWRFTVIRDEASIKEIVADILPGNVLIVISGPESTQPGNSVQFDCGLATQNMYIAAQSLGLGAHIYGSPAVTVARRRENFQVPEGYNPVMILRIGNTDKNVDAVSSASPRNAASEVVNYKK